MSNADQKVHSSFKALAAHGAETGVKKGDKFSAPPHLILEEPGFNERDYESPEVVAQIEGFAKAYQAGEIVPPLLCRVEPSTGAIYVVDGHQRRRGALLAISRGTEIKALDFVPFRGNDVDRLVVQVRSSRGLKLSTLGLSNISLKLLRKGLTIAEIAERLDVSTTTIDGYLVLATADSDVHAMVKAEQVPPSVAIDAVRKYADKAGEKLAEKLVQAKAKGKTSVKASAVKDWAPPRKVSLNLFTSITPVYKAIAEDSVLKELLDSKEDIDPSTLQGKTVTLGAATVLELCRNFQIAQKLKNKRAGNTEDASSQDEDQADSKA